MMAELWLLWTRRLCMITYFDMASSELLGKTINKVDLYMYFVAEINVDLYSFRGWRESVEMVIFVRLW